MATDRVKRRVCTVAAVGATVAWVLLDPSSAVRFGLLPIWLGLVGYWLWSRRG